MKKVVFALFIFIFLINTSLADVNIKKGDIITVKFNKCVDGDTAHFDYKNETIKVRFLAINTPESTTKIEPYGKEASEYTCNSLKKAKIIKLEFDKKSDIKDKYDRYLAWIFVDGNLLQKNLINESLAEVKYIYCDYKYLDEIQELENKVKVNKQKIWEDEKEENTSLLYVIGAIILAVLVKGINKEIKKIKKRLK